MDPTFSESLSRLRLPQAHRRPSDSFRKFRESAGWGVFGAPQGCLFEFPLRMSLKNAR